MVVIQPRSFRFGLEFGLFEFRGTAVPLEGERPFSYGMQPTTAATGLRQPKGSEARCAFLNDLCPTFFRLLPLVSRLLASQVLARTNRPVQDLNVRSPPADGPSARKNPGSQEDAGLAHAYFARLIARNN